MTSNKIADMSLKERIEYNREIDRKRDQLKPAMQDALNKQKYDVYMQLLDQYYQLKNINLF